MQMLVSFGRYVQSTKMVHAALLLEPVTTDLVFTICLQHPKTSAVRQLGRPITPSVEGTTDMPLKRVHLHRLPQISDTNWPMCKPNDRLRLLVHLANVRALANDRFAPEVAVP